MSKKIVFITNGKGVKKLHDAEGKIGEFVDSKNNIVESERGLERNNKIENLWFLAFDSEIDADKIERVRKLKSFGSTIQETNSVPIIGQVNMLKSLNDPNRAITQTAALIEAQKQFDVEKRQLSKDSARYGQLFAQICKNGGGYVVNADPQLVAEFEQLKSKLGIEEQNEENN